MEIARRQRCLSAAMRCGIAPLPILRIALRAACGRPSPSGRLSLRGGGKAFSAGAARPLGAGASRPSLDVVAPTAHDSVHAGDDRSHAPPVTAPGFAADKRPDCQQVCIGLVVTPGGPPLAHEVFAGNRADATDAHQRTVGVAGVHRCHARAAGADDGVADAPAILGAAEPDAGTEGAVGGTVQDLGIDEKIVAHAVGASAVLERLVGGKIIEAGRDAEAAGAGLDEVEILENEPVAIIGHDQGPVMRVDFETQLEAVGGWVPEGVHEIEGGSLTRITKHTGALPDRRIEAGECDAFGGLVIAAADIDGVAGLNGGGGLGERGPGFLEGAGGGIIACRGDEIGLAGDRAVLDCGCLKMDRSAP